MRSEGKKLADQLVERGVPIPSNWDAPSVNLETIPVNLTNLIMRGERTDPIAFDMASEEEWQAHKPNPLTATPSKNSHSKNTTINACLSRVVEQC
jgi:hypothetical protein